MRPARATRFAQRDLRNSIVATALWAVRARPAGPWLQAPNDNACPSMKNRAHALHQRVIPSRLGDTVEGPHNRSVDYTAHTA